MSKALLNTKPRYPRITEKIEFGSMPNFRDPVVEVETDTDDEDDITLIELMKQTT